MQKQAVQTCTGVCLLEERVQLYGGQDVPVFKTNKKICYKRDSLLLFRKIIAPLIVGACSRSSAMLVLIYSVCGLPIISLRFLTVGRI